MKYIMPHIRILERALEGVSSVEDFLSSPSCIESYFSSCQEYYGEHNFPRLHFDAILEQVKKIHQLDPAFGPHIWQQQNTQKKAFSLKLDRSVSRGVNQDLWLKYLAEWKAKLRREFESVPCHEDFYEFRAWATTILDTTNKEITLFRKKERNRGEEIDFFTELSHRKDLNIIAARCVYESLSLPHRDTIFHCGDGEVIMTLIRGFRSHPQKILYGLDLFAPSAPLLALLRRRIPPLAELVQRYDIFTLKNDSELRETTNLKAGTYYFEPVPRRFHGIWRGIPVKDCMTQKAIPGCPLPGRWLPALVEGAETIHVRTDGRYYGSIHILPIHYQGNSWYYAEFCSTILSLLVTETNRSAEKPMPFYFRVLQELHERKEDKKGFCISSDRIFDNWGVTRLIQESILCRLGETLGAAENFTIHDPIIERALAALPVKLAPDFNPGISFRENENLFHPIRNKKAEIYHLWIGT